MYISIRYDQIDVPTAQAVVDLGRTARNSCVITPCKRSAYNSLTPRPLTSQSTRTIHSFHAIFRTYAKAVESDPTRQLMSYYQLVEQTA